MSEGAKPARMSPHPVIEVRKWDESGVLGRHLSVLAVRVAYAVSNFANSDTGLCYPSLATVRAIVQVHRTTLRKALNEIAQLGVPLQRAGRLTGRRRTGHAYAGPVQWAIVPFDREMAENLLREIPRQTRRRGRVSDSLLEAHSELSESLVDAQSEASESLHSTFQSAPCVGHEQYTIRRKTKDYSKGSKLMPSSTKREALEGGVDGKRAARVRGAARWSHTGKPLLGARRRMRKKGIKRDERTLRVR